MRQTRAVREGQERARAEADARDKAERADGLREARAQMSETLRAAVIAGPRRAKLRVEDASPEQRARIDSGQRGEPVEPEHTREEISAAMNERMRDRLFAGKEQRAEERREETERGAA